MNDLKFMIGRGSTFYDYTEYVVKVVHSGRKGAAPRSLNVTLSNPAGNKRIKADCGSGQTCVLYENGKEIFRGLLMKDTSNNKHTATLLAYDNCIRICNNKDSFSYKKKTATQIVADCLKKLGLSAGSLANTGYVIGELIKKATTYWDVIQDALSQTYLATGRRYYLSASGGKIYLKRRVEQSTMPILELTTNIESYDRTRSIENTRTRLKLTTSKGKAKGSTTNSSLESQIGVFQEVKTVDEDITKTEINQMIKTFVEEQNIIGQSLTVTAAGDSSIISGGCVYVYIPDEDLKRIMYVDEDTHTWEKGRHYMTLKLNYAKDIDKAG